jgi:hypothetical protein
MQEKDRSAFADIIQCDGGIRDLDLGCYRSSPRSVWYSSKPSAGLSHDIASDIQVWSVGGASAGWSKLPTVTEISFGHPSCQYVNGVPHLGQNVRRTDADERYSVGEPAVIANPSLATVTSPRA